MAVSQGMNHPAVLAAAGLLDTDQQKMADLMQRAATVLSTLGQNWFGKDSNQFALDWANHSRHLQMATDAIGAMSRQARVQASDQRATSTS
jgi:uncharacterized protein YukE